jgi:EAL domain-containing protein (putative c-di-GMP-specific phosphodiesterase class I)
VVSAVVGLGHLLGLKVVAEGVETRVQRDEIDEIGCDGAQGHFYAVPMSPDEISWRLALDPAGPLVLPPMLDGTGSLRA